MVWDPEQKVCGWGAASGLHLGVEHRVFHKCWGTIFSLSGPLLMNSSPGAAKWSTLAGLSVALPHVSVSALSHSSCFCLWLETICLPVLGRPDVPSFLSGPAQPSPARLPANSKGSLQIVCLAGCGLCFPGGHHTKCSNVAIKHARRR